MFNLGNKITVKKMLQKVYPVGSIYMSVNNTSPATLFGGTWEQVQDRFLLAAGTTYSAGSTGGEATHKLTVDEMPSHNHYSYLRNGGTPFVDGGGTGSRFTQYQFQAKDAANNPAMMTGNAGSSQAHNNMPPYLTVYVWKRTA